MIQQAKEKLSSVFGFDSFRPQQEEIIQHVLSGKDSIVLMPTGGGKSVCFQIPALVQKGTTLVVSPLISLMKDQVEALKSNGVEAAFFNSSQSDAEKTWIIQEALSGKFDLIYMAPETLFHAINSWLKDVEISLIAIDEAHCVSMWGHDFRPEYTQIHTLREYWENVPFMALTATADKATRKEIQNNLGLHSPKTFLSSFDRPNLSLTVRGNIKKSRKQEEVLQFIEKRKGQSGIIYCLSKRETEEWADYLQKMGIKAAYYHAGLNSQKRSQIQEDFIKDEVPIITATIAFGMGIDKPNVRWVIHNNLPKNLEGYYQEIGRAGRDGLPSDTLLYYNMRDVKLLGDFARDSPQQDVLVEKLNRMLQYAETQTCRRKTLLSYFSETLEQNCGNCDVCKNPPKFFDGTVISQMALSALKRTQESVGMNLLIQILRGAKTVDVFSKGFHKIKTYGVGKDYSNDDWRHFMIQLLNYGLIEILYDQNFILKVTPFGERVLFDKEKIYLTRFEASKQAAENSSEQKIKATPSEFSKEQDELFELLRQMRKEKAKEENVPPYIVFSDVALMGMVEILPSEIDQLLKVSGIGKVKAEKYGSEIIEMINNFVETHQMERPNVSEFLDVNQPVKPAKKKKKKKTKGDTYKITLELYQSGMSAEEIAQERELAETTIVGHLCQLYSQGEKVDLKSMVSDEEYSKVKNAVEQVGETYPLKPIFNFLDASIPFHTIRVAVTLMENTNKVDENGELSKKVV